MLDWIYTAISWILLRWHELWSFILPGHHYWLGTNWDWILGIVFLVITIRIILFPVFVKQIRSQRAMQALQPKMKALQEKHKGDPQALREEMMKLYQSEKVNPLMGCLPMFLQIPVFLGLFHVLKRLDPFQIKNTTLYTWTQDQWDSAVDAKLFTAPIWGRFVSPDSELSVSHASGTVVKVVAGVLVLIMMVTTYMTSRQMILKTGWNPDPQQRMIQKLMLYGIPISLLLSGWYFPIGVIIYWVTQNLFSYGQQYWVLHKYPPPSVAGAMPLKSSGAKAAPGKALPGKATKPAPGVKPAKAAPGATKSTAPAPGAKPATGAKSTPAAKATPPAKASPAAEAAPNAKADPEAKPAVGAGPSVGPSPTVGARPGAAGKAPSDDGAKATPAKASQAKAAPAAKGTSNDGAPPSGSDGTSGDSDSRSGAFRRSPDGASAPVPPGESQPAVPRVGAKPPSRARKKGPASKSSRKGGSKR